METRKGEGNETELDTCHRQDLYTPYTRAAEPIPLVVQESLEKTVSKEEKQLAARRSLHDRLKEQRALNYRNLVRRAKVSNEVPCLGNLSTVAELPSEEERTQCSRSTKPRRRRKNKSASPPIEVVSYDSSLGESQSVAAVDDDI